MKYPYFRATAWDSNIALMERWYRHFFDLGHPVALYHKRDHGKNLYSVWRYGYEFLAYEESKANGEGIDNTMTVLQTANGFTASS